LEAELANCYRSTPKTLWEILRAVTGRFLWNTRCTKCMEGTEIDHHAVIQKIWHRMKTYLNAKWDKLNTQVAKGRILLI
jgi:hypothetical protein